MEKSKSTGDRNRLSAFCIAGTHSGCGKTTVSLGIMSALTRRGFSVQPFKVGPDFIDPGHHSRITGRDSHNLDSWMLDLSQNQEIFNRYTMDADAAVVEGVMGLFDGVSGDDESGSTAQMAKWLELPVFLVIDARSMARSAAAVALGYSRFDRGLKVQGVIFNRVASERHGEMLKEALQSRLDLPVYGCLPREDKLQVPSRHLGLVTDEDFSIGHRQMEFLGQWVEDNLDLSQILSISERNKGLPFEKVLDRSSRVRVGIAKDEAFCFYYPENLRLLCEAGAELVSFSPIRSKELPEGIKGLYLGGGYPELHCQKLSANQGLLESIREFAMGGGPVYAECGGFMYLTTEILDPQGNAYPMADIFPFSTKMDSQLRSLGYREIRTKKDSILGSAGTRVRGHEFHYSHLQERKAGPEAIYSIVEGRPSGDTDEGFLREGVLGSYIHLHFASSPAVATNFVEYCRIHG